MPIDFTDLSSLVSDYAKGMSSIRGRRVQRLLKREFAGAEYVFIVQVGAEKPAVLGLSPSGAAVCSTDGRGKQATVVKWLHGSTEGVETGFDLLKDSLPAIGAASVPLAEHARMALIHLSPSSISPDARALVTMAIRALHSRGL